MVFLVLESERDNEPTKGFVVVIAFFVIENLDPLFLAETLKNLVGFFIFLYFYCAGLPFATNLNFLLDLLIYRIPP